MDPIERKAAIEAFDCTDELIVSGSANAQNVMNYINKVIGKINALPSAQPEQRWISVKERLPEKNGRYLVTRGLKACNSIWNRVYIINYSDLMGLKAEKIWWDGNVGKSDFELIDDVLAWCELPEPYWEGCEQIV